MQILIDQMEFQLRFQEQEEMFLRCRVVMAQNRSWRMVNKNRINADLRRIFPVLETRSCS